MKPLKYTRKADIFGKVCIVLGNVFFLLWIAAEFLSAYGYINIAVSYFCMLILFISGSIVFIYPFIFEHESEDFDSKIKPDKFSTAFSSFDEFFENAEKSLGNFGLTKISTQKYDTYEQHLYSTGKIFPHKDFVVIINAEDISNEILNHSSEEFVKFAESYYKRGLNRIAWKINIITIICTNRVTPALRKLLNTNGGTEQDFGIGRFFSAISFGRKNLYLINRKGLTGRTKYKKCRKKFLNYFSFLFPEQTDK